MKKLLVQIGGVLLMLIFISCTTVSSSEIFLPIQCNNFSFSPRLDKVIYKCNDTHWLAPLPNLENSVRINFMDDPLRIWSIRAWKPDGEAFLLNSFDPTEHTQTWWLVKSNTLDNKLPLCTMPSGEQSILWSPIGTRLVVIDSMGGTTLIFTDGNGCEALPISGRVMRSLALSWSPDGQKIAYTYTPYAEGTEGSEIRVIDLNTRHITTIYSKGGLPEWSPDGQKILLFGWQGSIPIVDANGKGLIDEVKISEGYTVKRSRGNVWSSDGSRIALYLQNDGPENEPVAIGVLNLNTLTISAFDVPLFSEILGWTVDNEAIVIRMHTDKGHILKEIPVTD